MEKNKVCKCGCQFKQYNSLIWWCSYECKKKYSKPPNLKLKSIYKIPKVSDKRKIDNFKYSVLRIEFLGKKENKICPITKQPTTDIHHMRGRVGSLFLDTNFWIALSREGHKFVEENPKWAKENGYSFDRLNK